MGPNEVTGESFDRWYQVLCSDLKKGRRRDLLFDLKTLLKNVDSVVVGKTWTASGPAIIQSQMSYLRKRLKDAKTAGTPRLIDEKLEPLRKRLRSARSVRA